MNVGLSLALSEHAVNFVADSGLIAFGEVHFTRIEAHPPTVQIRDSLQEAQVRQIDMGLGILSPQTATAQTGHDYEQERVNIENHQDAIVGLPGLGAEL